MKEIKTKEFFMKRMLILMVAVCILFSFLFTGCEEDPAAGAATGDELTTLIMASMASSMIPMGFAMNPPPAGTYNGPALNGMIVTGQLIVAGGVASTTFTFNECALDVDEPVDNVADLTLGGAFLKEVVAGPPMEITITYSDLALTGTIPGSVDPISIIVAGTFVMVFTIYDGALDDIAQTRDVDITISGITAAPAVIIIQIEEIVTVIDDPNTPNVDEEETESELISATIGGVDYTAEFAEIFASD